MILFIMIEVITTFFTRHSLCISVYGISIGQQMLLPGQQNILVDKLDALQFPSEQTMMLISLIRKMVSFNPDDRPDFNSIFHQFMNMRRGIIMLYTCISF